MNAENPVQIDRAAGSREGLAGRRSADQACPRVARVYAQRIRVPLPIARLQVP
jgi:hypothetical protein